MNEWIRKLEFIESILLESLLLLHRMFPHSYSLLSVKFCLHSWDEIFCHIFNVMPIYVVNYEFIHSLCILLVGVGVVVVVLKGAELTFCKFVPAHQTFTVTS
ncbi:hypothetical protein T10_9192 [Trichinella papuae]|uniref:Uncharacterized protein n=1 Tax=Trichinella papuae TaxID=268474 RepID=A0A0V1M4D9_9BILA|nr:hypothetical protein T10_9192 [Trichinella papuae]